VLPRAILGLIAALALWSLAIAATAGFDLRPYGIPFRSTNPDRTAVAAFVLAAVYLLAFREDARRRLTRADSAVKPMLADLQRRAPYITLAAAVLVGFLGVKYGLLVAGGSDSYGYVSQADLFLAGDLITEQPIASQVPWPRAEETFAPLGYKPALDPPGAIVPTYAAGLSVLMATGKSLVGACGPYLVTPILGGLMVWLTYWLGAMLWSPLVGLLAAMLIATSPTFLFMLANPMSDVPVSACFTAGLVAALSPWRAKALWTGVFVSLAIFIRPNLVPLGAVFLGWLVLRSPAGHERWRAALWFAAGGLPLILAVAAVNNHLYGAPWMSGYGSLDHYYAWHYFTVNLRRYSSWLVETETVLVALAFVPLLMLGRVDAGRRGAFVFVTLFVAAVWLSYLFYTPYEVWWFLRFLLPAFPVIAVMASIGGDLLLTRMRFQPMLAAGAIVAIFVLALRVNDVRERALLTLWRGGIVYASAAEFIRAQLPANAVILTVQHSGSVRYYANRLTLRWDQLAPEWYPRTLAILVERGYRPFLLISYFEEAPLRQHFKLPATDDGPGTIVAFMADPHGVRLYDPLRQMTAPTVAMPEVIPCPCGVMP
jgi:hypothetical protein